MLHRAVAGGEPGADFVGVVIERAHAAAVRNVAGFVDDVEAFGPCRVGVVGGVADVIDAEGDGIVEAFDEIVGDGYTLSEGFRLSVTHVVLHVGLHLPLVGGMGFADIDCQKVGVIFVIVVNLHHVTDVAAKGRSSVAAEDDDEGASAGTLADVEMIGTVESHEASVRSVVPNLQAAAMHVGQGIAQHEVCVPGATRHFAKNEKDGKQKNQEYGNRPFPEESHRELFHPLKSASSQD